MSAKLTDLVKTKDFTYSIEVTPNIAFDEVDKLTISPAFFNVTWHAKSHGCDSLDIAPLKLARHLKSNGKNVCLHLSCDLLKKEYLHKLLKHLQDQGICNLFIILGESYDATASEFKSSKELVEYIRQRSGDYFCIGVAGYSEDPKTLKALKEKVESGANFIFTQAFTDFNVYKSFVKECEKLGINVPIIPGTFLYVKFTELEAFSKLCRTKISDELLQNKDNENVTGIDVVKKLIVEIKKSGFGNNHVHLYTMNKLDRVQQFIKEIEKN